MYIPNKIPTLIFSSDLEKELYLKKLRDSWDEEIRNLPIRFSYKIVDNNLNLLFPITIYFFLIN